MTYDKATLEAVAAYLDAWADAMTTQKSRWAARWAARMARDAISNPDLLIQRPSV